MKTTDLIAVLRRLKVETGSLACLGCGHEHNCGTRGCAILREAIAALKHNGWIRAEDKLPTDKDAISRTEAMRQFTDEPQATYSLAQIVAILDALPSVDAVEVVRCGECRFGALVTEKAQPQMVKCSAVSGITLRGKTFYCAYGQRRKRR